MCSIDSCEFPWFGGVAGVCNNVTQNCDCPEGFTGADMLYDFNDCHQNPLVAKPLYAVAFGFTVTSLLAQIAFTSAACCRTYKIKKLSPRLAQYPREEMSTYLVSSGPPSHNQEFSMSRTRSDPSLNETSARTKARKNTMLRQSLICLGIHFLFLFTEGCKTPFLVELIFNPHNRDSITPATSFFVSLGWASFYAGSWLYLYIFYKTLPDIAHLSRLLKIKNILVRYPKQCFTVAVCCALLGFAGFVIIGLILSLRPTRDPLDPFNWHMFPLWSGVNLFMIFIVFVPLTSTILRVFRSARESFPENENIARAVNHLEISRATMIIVGIVEIPFDIFHSTLVGERYMYVWICLSSTAISISAVSGLVLIITMGFGVDKSSSL